MKPLVVCLTPVRNEAWILPRFLACTSLWADHIIIADQGSTDGSADLARKHPKVTLIENQSREFNEPQRQQMLIAEARKLSGPKILIALDADEIFSANLINNPEWAHVLSAPPGTVIHARWANLLPGGDRVSDMGYELPCGFVDDGTPHRGDAIHSPRIPIPVGTPSVKFAVVRLLHYNLIDPLRTESKRRWYMCLERRLFPLKSIVQIFDKYNYAGVHAQIPTAPLQPAWLEGYEQRGINMRSVHRDLLPGTSQPVFWYDHEVAAWLEELGPAYFQRVPIWTADWLHLWSALQKHDALAGRDDPRGQTLKLIHWGMIRWGVTRFDWLSRCYFWGLRATGF